MVTRVEPENYLSRLRQTRLSPESRAYTALREEGDTPKYFPAYAQYPYQSLLEEPTQINSNLLGLVAIVGIVAIVAMFMYRKR